MDLFLERHSGELLILILALILFSTLLILVPQLLRSYQRSVDAQHAETMAALDKGQLLPRRDEAARAAGRTAALVPMVTVCAAGTVTCFMAASRTDDLFGVTLTIWAVAGLVSLAAVTGGIALLGRLAQLHVGDELEEPQAETRK
jgi:hypothetical protein